MEYYVDAKMFTLSHIAGGYLNPPEVCSSITKVVEALVTEVEIIDGFKMDETCVNTIRRNIAHSFKPDANIFTLMIENKDDKKHLFRVDKQIIKIGVNLK